MDHSLQLKYQRNYSIIINDCDVSLLIMESAISKLTWNFSTHTAFMKS